MPYSNTTFVKVKCKRATTAKYIGNNSNTTFVKVKYMKQTAYTKLYGYSNTTFVKVKLFIQFIVNISFIIQIQHLLKLNARKINLYDFIVLLKVLINKDFSYFLPAIMRFEGI